jgi:hypothetical protein
MSRPPDLPDDLERLGHHLEAAVTVAVRRHSQRRAVMSFVGAVVIAVPFALAGAATSLSPGVGTVPTPGVGTVLRPVEAAEPPVATVAPDRPGNGFIVRRVPARFVPPRPSQPCFDAKGCRVPANPDFRPPRLGRY